jgi:hypothetical protein
MLAIALVNAFAPADRRRTWRLEARRLEAEERFVIEAAGHLLSEVVAPWVQDLGILLVETIESSRPAGAPRDWQPGAMLRLPFAANCAARAGCCACRR